MTNETYYTDLGRELAVLRREALRRLRVVENRGGRALEQVYESPPGGGPNRWRPLSTDELVARVESHADIWTLAEELGTAPLVGGLGTWAVPTR